MRVFIDPILRIIPVVKLEDQAISVGLETKVEIGYFGDLEKVEECEK